MSEFRNGWLRVQDKLERATKLREEFEEELLLYYKSNPVKLLVMKEPDGQQASIMRAHVPPRVALVAGDVLQCLRSSLDYLVWELAGSNAHKQNQFPISLTESHFENEISKRKRLMGVPDKASSLIDDSQPYHLPESEREGAILSVLETLTNVNKHRRVILTHIQKASGPTEPLPFPHIASDIVGTHSDGTRQKFETLGFYVAFNEGPVSGQEIGATLDRIGNFIGHEMLPRFRHFLE